MKGVSAVIAVILILMIVVALAALAYTWFTGIFSSLTTTAGESITGTTESMGKQFALDAVGCNSGTLSVSVRNTGTSNLNASLVSIYLMGNLQVNNSGPSEPINPGTVQPYVFTGTSCGSDDIVRVTIENGVSASVILP